ncbi:MAG TPA: ABC transporter permease [Eubacteriaceae bacterium]|jgi:NitT/TauT family transport system permease protein|nr:ABC transporter permease [Eubacteriaceae bacterium]
MSLKNDTQNYSQTFSREHLNYLKDIKRQKILILSSRIILLVAFFLIWEVAAKFKWIDPFITSQPSRMWDTFLSLHQNGSLYKHIGITISETIIGFVSGTLLGSLMAILLWWSDFLSKVLDPYLVVLNSLPKVALGPIIIVFFGAGYSAIITMALLVSLFTTIIGVFSGLRQVDKEKITLLKTFGANKKQILTKVVIPASFPTIMNALRINVGLSWVGVIMGEFLVSKAGLGYLIVYGSQVFQLDTVMTSVIILAIAAALMYIGVSYLEKMVLEKRI